MTEQQWLSASDPEQMLEWLRQSGKTTERRLRLFAVACCRRIWHLLDEEGSRKAVEVSERYADGAIRPAMLRRARSSAGVIWMHDRPAALAAYVAAEEDISSGKASYIGWLAAGAIAQADGTALDMRRQEELREVAALLRCIFGNPFRVLPAQKASTGHILKLAQASYEERLLPEGHLDQTRLVVLADALEEAGCDGDLLAHLRSPGPHMRGCHAVDAILGRD